MKASAAWATAWPSTAAAPRRCTPTSRRGSSRRCIGEDPTFVERPVGKDVPRRHGHARSRASPAYALSALDIGLWDIVGKAAKLPLYKLWGAVTDRIPAYGSGGWAKYTDRRPARRSGEVRRAGLHVLQDEDPPSRPGGEPRSASAAVKKALGRSVRMMVDVNQRRDVLGNVRQARAARGFRPPLVRGAGARRRLRRLRGSGRDRSASRWPPARTTTRAGSSSELLDRKAMRYLMPDVCRANGFTETLRIGKLAAAHGVAADAAPHPRDLDPRRRRALQRLPGRVHGLGAARSL